MVGLGNVTNDAQVKKLASSTSGNVPTWNGSSGDALNNGYTVQTTLSSSTTALVRADAIKTAVDAKQNTITGGATTITGSNLTASRALVSDTNGKVAVSAVTSTELSYLDGVTSSIQTQFSNKANTTPELMLSTPVTANAGATATINLNTTLNLNSNPKIKIYWKTTGRWGYHCSEFLLESESYQKYVSGSTFNWNVDNSPARIEFYTVNFTFSSSASSSSLVDRITIQNGKRWFLDGSYANSDDISDIQITVLSVTRSAG